MKVVPIILGALGTLPRDLMKWLEVIDAAGMLNVLQNACLLGSARILRRVLDIKIQQIPKVIGNGLVFVREGQQRYQAENNI